jgi:hypothetical protein
VAQATGRVEVLQHLYRNKRALSAYRVLQKGGQGPITESLWEINIKDKKFPFIIKDTSRKVHC